jgi:hypothetical protein
VLEDVGVDPIAGMTAVAGPDLTLGEANEIQRLLGEPVRAVRARLRIRKRGVDTLDGAGLALQITRSTVVALVRPSRDPTRSPTR